MTISQALRKISKLKGALKEQLARAARSVVYTGDNVPAFSFASSSDLAEALREELILLETHLRVTNAMTAIECHGKPMTLAEATCRLQESRGKIAWLKGLDTQAQSERTETTYEEHYRTEGRTAVIKTTKCDLPEARRAAWIQREQDFFDALNDVVEAVNHRTTLVQR